MLPIASPWGISDLSYAHVGSSYKVFEKRGVGSEMTATADGFCQPEGHLRILHTFVTFKNHALRTRTETGQ
jgi:hypothetical protein